MRKSGFTLPEIMMAVFIFSFVVAGALGVFIMEQHAWFISSLKMRTSGQASAGLERIVYGINQEPGLREAQAHTVSLEEWDNGIWLLRYNDGQWLSYVPWWRRIVNQDLIGVCDNVVTSTVDIVNTRGAELVITVEENGGTRTSTSTMNTFVEFRN